MCPHSKLRKAGTEDRIDSNSPNQELRVTLNLINPYQTLTVDKGAASCSRGHGDPLDFQDSRSALGAMAWQVDSPRPVGWAAWRQTPQTGWGGGHIPCLRQGPHLEIWDHTTFSDLGVPGIRLSAGTREPGQCLRVAGSLPFIQQTLLTPRLSVGRLCEAKWCRKASSLHRASNMAPGRMGVGKELRGEGGHPSCDPAAPAGTAELSRPDLALGPARP